MLQLCREREREIRSEKTERCRDLGREKECVRASLTATAIYRQALLHSPEMLSHLPHKDRLIGLHTDTHKSTHMHITTDNNSTCRTVSCTSCWSELEQISMKEFFQGVQRSLFITQVSFCFTESSAVIHRSDPTEPRWQKEELNVGRAGAAFYPHSTELCVVSLLASGEEVKRERATLANNSTASFLLLFFITSFQAESLLLRRKVSRREGECRRQWRKRGRRRRQRGEGGKQISNNRKQHTRTVRLCVRVPKRETARPRERSGKEGRESDAEAGRAGPPPLLLSLSFSPSLPFSPPLPSSLSLSVEQACSGIRLGVKKPWAMSPSLERDGSRNGVRYPVPLFLAPSVVSSAFSPVLCLLSRLGAWLCQSTCAGGRMRESVCVRMYACPCVCVYVWSHECLIIVGVCVFCITGMCPFIISSITFI